MRPTARSADPASPRPRTRPLTGIGRFARRAADLFPFTPLGLVVVGASGFALKRYGIARVDLLYLVIGAVGLGLPAVCLVLSTLAALGIAIGLRRAARREVERREAPALRLECGVRAATGFSLPGLWYLPMIRVRWSWTDPEAVVHATRERGRLHEHATPSRRGLEDVIERRIEIGDAFALTTIAFRHEEPRTVRSIPSTGALDRIRLSRSISAGDEVYDPLGAAEGERVDLRGYAPGDPIRFVLWKVFAKTRQLVVRTPERAVSPARRSIAYLIAAPGDEPSAGVARKAVETGALGQGFVLGADGVPDDARTPDEALELLARSGRGGAASPEAGGAGLAAFLRRAAPAPGTRAIVFVPAFDGPWRAKLTASRARLAHGLHVVVCTDGLDRQKRPSLARRLVMGHATSHHGAKPKLRDVEALVRALAGLGAEVVLVDRAHGKVYAGATVLARGAHAAEPPRARSDAASPRPGANPLARHGSTPPPPPPPPPSGASPARSEGS